MKRCLVVVLLVGVLPFAEPARAQPQDGGHITLLSQTSWVRPGDIAEFHLRVESTAPLDDLEVALVAYQRVGSRSAFVRTLNDERLGSVLGVTSFPLAGLVRDPEGVVVRLGIQDPARARDASRLALPREGVYPLRIELRDRSGVALDGFTTHLVNITPDVRAPKLGVVLVVPVHAAPSMLPNGTRRFDNLGQLASTTQVLAEVPGVPLVVAPTPETLEALEASRQPEAQAVLANLRGALTGRQVLAGTYVPVNLPSLLAAGLNDEANFQVLTGLQVVSRVLPVALDRSTWLANEFLDNVTLTGLDGLKVGRVIVPESALTPVRLPVTLARPFLLAGDNDLAMKAAAGEEGLSAHFTNAPPALAAHQLLADLAVLFFDQPAAQRGVVALPPHTWAPDPRFLREVLNGLAQSPIVTPMTVDTLFNAVEPANDQRNVPLIRRLATDRSSTVSSQLAGDTRELRRDLCGFGLLFNRGDPTPCESAPAQRLDRRLLISQSVDLRNNAARRTYTSAVRRELNRAVQLPSPRTITLTARRGLIPVTFRNNTGLPVDVDVALQSEKLQFPNGARRSVHLEPHDSTQRFSVLTRTSGAFPLEIMVESPRGPSVPEGILHLGSARFRIRSTAASGVGVFLSVGAGLFLTGWWGRHIRRARRLKMSG